MFLKLGYRLGSSVRRGGSHHAVRSYDDSVDWWMRVLAFIAAAACIAYLADRFRRLPAVWRGDKRAIATIRGTWADVYARSYVVHLARNFAACAGAALLCIAVGVSPAGRTVGVIGILLWLCYVPLLLLHWFVNATNRPKFLVPPPYRDEQGGVALARLRRRRQKAGQAPTDHEVEILDVRPRPGDSYEPYLMAMCSADGCDWQEFPDAKDVDEMQSLREKTRRHTSRPIEKVVRPIG
jgi:hypothetical protein